MKLTCIDTFSGIGGISLGLRDFITTIQYCEWDSYCQQVLLERMSEGRIDRAPIHNDIKNLYISPAIKPNMLCGGFPCQDISSIGLQKGITEGERSSMFYHMMRIVDECPTISIVFLENVANILSVGMKEVVEELTKRHFNFQWMLLSAADQGAPHVRNRWFCLASKANQPLPDITLPSNLTPPNIWQTEPLTRITFKPSIKEDASYDPQWINRCHTLGNSVVPSVVREAFITLYKNAMKWQNITECFGDYAVDISPTTQIFPESGLVYGNKLYYLPKKLSTTKPHSIPITIFKDDKLQTLMNFPTPRRGITHPSSLTDRSIRDLPTILVYSEQNNEYLKQANLKRHDKLHTQILPNINYIEWMMGYEANWTKIINSTKKQDTSKEIEEQNNIQPIEKKPNRLNGMHVLMREMVGKDVKTVAERWRGLSTEEKEVYSRKAKSLLMSSQTTLN